MTLHVAARNWPDAKPKGERSDAANWALTIMFAACLVALCWLIRDLRAEHKTTVSNNTEAHQINAKWSRALAILENEK